MTSSGTPAPTTGRAEYYAAGSEAGNDLERREVNAVDIAISVNDSVCVYSRIFGTRTCEQVYSTFVNSFSFSSGLVSSLVATDSGNATNGDSGGPVSLGTTAMGGLRGAQWIWFGSRNTFTWASLFPLAIGVAVLVQ